MQHATQTQDHLSRRRWLCGCAGSLLLSGCGGGGSDTTPAASPRGCLSVSATAAQATISPGCGVPTRTTGNTSLDSAFMAEFDYQARFWAIPGVSFAFLNDCSNPNAFANPQDRSILFGITLATKLLRDFGNVIPLWQVIAHEWGHQIQFSLGDNWLTSSTAAPKELEADMFSGFYLLIAKNSANLSTSITNAFTLGDWAFNNPAHHGTPAQRGAAVLAGGRVALEYVSGTIPRTYPAIRQRFLQELSFIL